MVYIYGMSMVIVNRFMQQLSTSNQVNKYPGNFEAASCIYWPYNFKINVEYIFYAFFCGRNDGDSRETARCHHVNQQQQLANSLESPSCHAARTRGLYSVIYKI